MARTANLNSKPCVHPARMIRLKDRRTSIRMEPEYWAALDKAATIEATTEGEMVARAQKRYSAYSMTSAIRVFLLEYFSSKKMG